MDHFWNDAMFSRDKKSTKKNKNTQTGSGGIPSGIEDLPGVTDKIEQMEIETGSKSRKSNELKEWEPWNVARKPRITDEELREWIEQSNQDQESRTLKRILKTLEGLLEGKDQN